MTAVAVDDDEYVYIDAESLMDYNVTIRRLGKFGSGNFVRGILFENCVRGFVRGIMSGGIWSRGLCPASARRWSYDILMIWNENTKIVSSKNTQGKVFFVILRGIFSECQPFRIVEYLLLHDMFTLILLLYRFI